MIHINWISEFIKVWYMSPQYVLLSKFLTYSNSKKTTS